ncbi:MAG TPA: D-glycero-D-manno-heptose 1-phosphate guanosyltransferase [Campylobacterales bacterium]|nr:D-glycero-D-manno-heptose 1-phosphate guanosyltransferase [Campylobacterales bacterium]HHS93660.1 D-glycero-D-manno-heptose 1-phosphate guanosyltransferase [Campylobacterales bacterium]
MEAIVLAGGLGTRLKSVVSDVPKPMALVAQKPFLSYLLEYLNSYGVSRVVLAVGYKWEVIEAYFGQDFKGMELLYSVEQEPLGTGGAVKKALEMISGEEVLMLNGDTYFKVDLKRLQIRPNSKITLSLKEMQDFNRYGSVEFNETGRLTSFQEKCYKEQGYINGGVYLLRRDIFCDYHLSKNFSFEKFLENNFKNLGISTERSNAYFIDIGIPEDYRRAQCELKSL